MGRQIAVVYSKQGPECHDTARVLAFLYLLTAGMGPAIELVKQGSARALELWEKVSGTVLDAQRGHHPLVCVLSNEDGNQEVVSVAVEPDVATLRSMLSVASVSCCGVEELPETFFLLTREAKPRPASY